MNTSVNTATSESSNDLVNLSRAARSKRLLVLDYDGTLARLAVDWALVREELSRRAGDLGFNSSFSPMWGEMNRFRTEHESHVPELFEVLRPHERQGVIQQKPLESIVAQVRSIDQQQDIALAVFSVNLHDTITTGLDLLKIEGISQIIGCDDVHAWKPDPEGLKLIIGHTGVAPEETLFVGNSPRDAQAAQAAGVDFVLV